jgi:hypothetical protein
MLIKCDNIDTSHRRGRVSQPGLSSSQLEQQVDARCVKHARPSIFTTLLPDGSKRVAVALQSLPVLEIWM